MNAAERERRARAASHAKRDAWAAGLLIVAAVAVWLAAVPPMIRAGNASAALVAVAAVAGLFCGAVRMTWRALVTWESQ